MPPLTAQGRAKALEGLAQRRKAAKTQTHINNSSLYAGEPMYYYCKGCGLQNIVMPEGWFTGKPDFCDECQAVYDCGWLE